MLNLLNRNYSAPVSFVAPTVSVSKRANHSPEVTVTTIEGNKLKLNIAQARPLAEALLDVATALEQALEVHQGLRGLNLSLDEFRPLAETLMNSSSCVDAVLGELQ